MKKIIVLTLLFFTSVVIGAQRYKTTDHFEIEDFSIKPGATVTVDLKLTNPTKKYYAVTCMMNLPDGVSLVGVAPDGNRMTDASHYYNYNTKNKKSGLCVIAAPSKGTPVQGNSGIIMKLTLQCDANAKEGLYNVSFAGSGLTPERWTDYITPDGYSEYLTPANEFKLSIGNPVNYELWVGGTQVTSANRTDILENGNFSYDPDKNMLTVSGGLDTKENGIDNRINGLTVYVTKNATISVSGYKTAILTTKNLNVTGPGLLTLRAENDCGIFVKENATLRIEDAYIDASGQWGISGPYGNSFNAKLNIVNSTIVSKSNATDGAVCDFLGGITLEDCEIVVPKGGQVKASVIVDADGKPAKEVKVGRKYARADVNRDGAIDSADIVAVIKEMPDGDMKADVNGDGAIDSADIVAVIKAMK